MRRCKGGDEEKGGDEDNINEDGKGGDTCKGMRRREVCEDFIYGEEGKGDE